MANLGDFDASAVEPMASFEPLPEGKYCAVISDSTMKPTRSNTGKYLELAFTIAEGQHKGRRVWARLNLENPNQQAVKIARSELSAICRAVGVIHPKDSVELHNLPLCIRVKCKTRSDTGEITNEIKGYEKKGAALSVAAANAAPQAAAGTAPWQR